MKMNRIVIAIVLVIALVCGGSYFYVRNENANAAALAQQQAVKKVVAEKVEADSLPDGARELSAMPVTILATDSDFIIKNGILTKYIGSGGDVIIPDSVTDIGDTAFFGSTSLKSITIPNSVTSIGESAFEGCTSLISVTIGSRVTTINRQAFYGCTALKSITIPDSVTSIEIAAFDGCIGLNSVTIGKGMTSINRQTFYGCTSLESLSIGSNVTYIGEMAFSRCTGLTSVVIPASVTYIDDDAFYGCTALTRVTIPDGAIVSDFAFGGCTSLSESALSGNVASYDELALAQVQVGDFLISNGVLMQYTGSGGNVVIPASVTFIYNGAFSNCIGLESVTIPDSVTKFGKSIFSGCANLKRVIFPKEGNSEEALKYIDIYDIFKSCPALEELVNCPVPTVSENLAANKSLIEAWSDPGSCVTPQSARITTLSNQICAGLTSDYKKAKAVFDWMAANIEYDYDEYYNHGPLGITVKYPEEVMDSKLAVCAGYARLTQALLQAQGIPALYVSGDTHRGRHAWNLAFVDGRWIYIDSTWGRPGVLDDDGTAVGYGYNPNWFDPTPLYFSLSHKSEASYINPNATHHSGTGDTPTTTGDFTDVPTSEYFAVPVTWAVKNGITSGTSGTTFSPNETCTTAQILTFLWRAKGSPEPTIKNPFSDVANNDYYAKAALWAYEKGLVSGSAFKANVPCTRSMVVTYLWKLAGKPAATGASNFTDVPSNADYAQAVAWAVSKGITSGTSSNTFSPNTTCTRGQIVTFLYRDFSK